MALDVNGIGILVAGSKRNAAIIFRSFPIWAGVSRPDANKMAVWSRFISNGYLH